MISLWEAKIILEFTLYEKVLAGNQSLGHTRSSALTRAVIR